MSSRIIACLILGYGILMATPGLANLHHGNTPFTSLEGTLSVRAIALNSTSPFRKWRAALARTQAAPGQIGLHGNNQWRDIIARMGALARPGKAGRGQ